MHWLSRHWFQATQSLGIVASLGFAAFSMRLTTKNVRVSNLLL